jgi:hypothetical protein
VSGPDFLNTTVLWFSFSPNLIPVAKFTFADYKSVSDYCKVMKFHFADYKSMSDYCIMMKFHFADYKSMSDYLQSDEISFCGLQVRVNSSGLCRIVMKFTFADYRSV